MLRPSLILCALVAAAFAVSKPPGIHTQPKKDIFYKAGETVELPCIASGEPRPSYDWKRNEIEFNPSGNDDRIVQLPNVGTLVINNPEDKDEGIFQCFASNDFGVSASIKINLREAKLDDFAVAAPSYHRPQMGDNYTLPCVPPDSVPQPSVFWVTKNEFGGMEPFNYDDRVSMDREYRLRFANVISDDYMRGLPYACVAMNNIMRQNSQGPLHYITPQGNSNYRPVQRLWSDQNDRFGLRGETFNVKCIFSGNPTPDVHWERTDNKSMPEDRFKLQSFAQELVIEDLQFEDAGSYECWATNTNSQERITLPFNIRVNSAAYFIQEPQDIEVGVGANVEFTCIAGGEPQPDIDFLVNGIALKDVADPRVKGPRFQRPVENKIFIENVEQTDHMVIQCNASNIHGYVFADFFLNVLSEAPTIVEAPSAVTVTAEGQPANLTCRTTGKPDPIITWFKDGQQITGGRYRILLNGDLYIRAVVLADAGYYICQAQNRFNITSAQGSMVVRRKTRIEQIPYDLEVNAGTDAKFTCSGTTDPEEVEKLQIIWLKDNKAITTNDQRMFTNIQDNSLTISGTITRDSGTYTCIATNGLDNDTASAVLTVKDRPDAPTRVYWEFCNKNATIHWMPGSYNNAPIQYYVLQYNTSFNPNQWNFGLQVNASLSKINMTLSPYVNYTFRIIAYNKIGASDPSFQSPEICPTKPDRPLHHPRNLRTLGHQPGKLYIEWTPIPEIQHNGPGFYYNVQILRVGAPTSETQNIPIDTWQTDHIEFATGKVYEAYQITLRAGNRIGEAAEDPPTIIGHSYESIPVITPTNLVVDKVGDTYAVLSWDFDKREIDKDDTRIRGEFRGFKIQFWEQNKRALTVREHDVGPESAQNTTGNTFTATVDHMLPNSNMEVQISVRNNYFIGSPTEAIQFKTEPGLPGPVEYFRPINIGDTHVNLEWGSPFENRGGLLGYDISYQLVKGLDLGEMQEREPQINDPYTTNAYLSGLMASSKYRVYIYARTAKGRGESYFIEIVTTKPGTPRMPRFTISKIGKDFINISWWINPYAASGTIVYLEYRKLDGPEWLRTTDEVINTWKVIDDLEPGTDYEVRIKATNGPVSVASGIEEVMTEGTALASALVGNWGWFCGMVLAILLIIGLIAALFVCYRSGFRFAGGTREYYGGQVVAEDVYSGNIDNTRHVGHDDENFGPEPRGYNNDYYDHRDYHNYDDGQYDDGGFEKRPPSYSSDIDNNHYPHPPPAAGEYEDYNRKPSDNYDDPEFEPGEPNKFDRKGAPREYYRDNQADDYYQRGDDDYYRRDDYDRRDSYDRRDDYDDQRRDYYDEEPHRVPSAPPSDASVSKPSSSTFV